MKISFKIILLVLVTALFLYLVLPMHGFPVQPPDSVQSLDKEDVETPYRRAYFTNFRREEVREFYRRQMGWSLLLNYPPEEALSLIRDQTKSTGLEEIVQPLRESVFINYFEPKDSKIPYRGQEYLQKITIRYLPTSLFVRLIISALGVILLVFILRELVQWKSQ